LDFIYEQEENMIRGPEKEANSAHGIFSAKSARGGSFLSLAQLVFLGNSTDSDKEKRPRNFRLDEIFVVAAGNDAETKMKEKGS
jgi:hypothetical protein